MRHVSDKSCREYQPHNLGSITISKNHAIYEIMWKNMRVKQATDDNIILHMCTACWIIKATDLHSEYVIIIAITRQQWLHKCTSMLCLHVHLPVLLIPHSITAWQMPELVRWEQHLWYILLNAEATYFTDNALSKVQVTGIILKQFTIPFFLTFSIHNHPAFSCHKLYAWQGITK